ncbi:MAG: NAD-dependent epimerase/dehydratase family protein [Gemmatimonadaceae bacterium]
MKVLVTGGTGVVGTAAVRALVAHDHEVRIFSRNAVRDVERWPKGVEAFTGSVGDAASLRGSMEGCDVVLHIAGIVAEQPPEITFARVNVEGTRNLVREAERADVGRVIYISSLGADRGTSEYHRSKRAAEDITRQFRNAWLILRPGNVYGPGDDVISLLLKMVRTLPAIPVIEGGDQPFQPIWADDLGEAIALAVQRPDLSRRTLELSGADRTSMHDVLDRLGVITGKTPVRIPLPSWLAEAGARVAGALGLELPVNVGQIQMLVEENVISVGELNALTTTFKITPTPLEVGLRRLADELPEQTPAEGTGRLHRRRFWADIVGSQLNATSLFARFRENFARYMPDATIQVAVERGTSTVPDEGETLTLGLPLRGTVQVRVLEVDERWMTLVTVEGHPLAAAIRFITEDKPDGAVRFEAQTYDRAATLIDAVMLSLVGDLLKDATWRAVVQRVVDDSGGRAASGINETDAVLEGKEAELIERWAEALVMAERRAEEAQRASP